MDVSSSAACHVPQPAEAAKCTASGLSVEASIFAKANQSNPKHSTWSRQSSTVGIAAFHFNFCLSS